MSPLTHHVSRSTWYVLAVIYLSMFAAVLSTMLYANHVAEQNSRRWCGVLRIYHQSAKDNPPPATQYGRDILAQLEQLYADFHCDRVPEPGRAEGGLP